MCMNDTLPALNGRTGWSNNDEAKFIAHLGYWNREVPIKSTRKKLLLKYREVIKARNEFPQFMDRETVLRYLDNAIEQECLA